MERFACATAVNAKNGVSGVRKTERDKTSFRRLSRTALARSRSISLSPSPDKRETEVVGIAKNPHHVHQTEPVMRQYCSIFYLSLWRAYGYSCHRRNTHIRISVP